LSEYLAFTNPFAADAAGWLAPGICSDNECRPLHHGFDHIRPFFDRYSGFVQPTQLLHPQTDASAIRKRRHIAALCYYFWGSTTNLANTQSLLPRDLSFSLSFTTNHNQQQENNDQNDCYLRFQLPGAVSPPNLGIRALQCLHG
jgi:hypothetical protein